MVVAVDAKGLILTSPNGIDWTSRSSATNEGLWTVRSNADQIVAAGGNGTIVTSPDNGNSWTSIESLDDGSIGLRGITWTDFSFILVGDTFGRSEINKDNTSMAFTSTDGTNWPPIDPGIDGVMQDIEWTGSRLLAVAFNSSLLTSTNSTHGKKYPQFPTMLSTAFSNTREQRSLAAATGLFCIGKIEIRVGMIL